MSPFQPQKNGKRSAQCVLGGVIVLAGFVGCATTPEPTQPALIEPRTPLLIQARELPARESAIYRDLISPAISESDRLSAARALLSLEGPDAQRAVESALSGQQAPEIHQAVFRAVALSNTEISPALVETLLSMLGVADRSLSLDLARALGQSSDPVLDQSLLAMVAYEQNPLSRRSDAILALSQHRTQEVAGTLVLLTDSNTPEELRLRAFESLAIMTGRDDLGEDHLAWQRWWEARQMTSEVAFRDELLSNIAQRAISRADDQDHLQLRLVESQAALYRATSVEDRPAVLAYMLSDPLVPIRVLAIDLALSRLLDDQPFPEPLRQALRDCLTDESAILRQRAALLLRDLADPLAANIAADRLMTQSEPATEVRRALLRLMERMPRPKAVVPALEMLDDPELRAEAAGALAASIDAELLSAEQQFMAGDRVRKNLEPNVEPSPEVITLLGKVGNGDDWDRIAGWVDSTTPEVKRAAVQAWADSDRSLKLLADRAEDPIVAPIVIAAAAERGEDPWTLLALVGKPPAQPQLLEAWKRAMIAMAGRVPADAMLQALPTLDQVSDDGLLREVMLTKTIEAAEDQEASSAKTPDSASDTGDVNASNEASMEPAVLALILERAETRLALAEPVGALDDFEILGDEHDQLDDQQIDRLGRGWIKAALATGRYEQAFRVAGELLGDGGNAEALAPTDDPIIDLFIEAAKRQVQIGDRRQGREIVAGLRDLLGSRIKPEVAQRIAMLEAQLGVEPGPSLVQPPLPDGDRQPNNSGEDSSDPSS